MIDGTDAGGLMIAGIATGGMIDGIDTGGMTLHGTATF